MLMPISTIAFPFEYSPTSYSERGLLVLTVDDTGEASCISCGSCEVVCPAQAITLSGELYGHRTLFHFGLDYKRCIFCGYCTSACPTDAIVHLPLFSYSVESIEDLHSSTALLYNMYAMGT